MSPVFAYYADLVNRVSEPDHVLFENVAGCITAWVQNEIGDGFTLVVDGAERYTNTRAVVSARREKLDGSNELFSVTYTHPNHERTLLYRLQIDLVRVLQGVQFGLTEAAHTFATGMVPLQVVPYLPGVIRALAGVANLAVLGEPVPLQAQRLEEKFAGRFVDTVLTAENRVLPVIAISPHPETGKPILPAEQLLVATFGLAHVVDLLTKQSTFEISNALGKEWSCYNGAVRIYWPGITSESEDFRRHPLYFPDHYPVGSQAELCADIFRRLAAAALVKFGDPPKLKVYRLAAERIRLARENARIAELTAGVEQSRELTALLNGIRGDNQKLRDDLDFARLEIAEARDQLAEQREGWAYVERQIAEATATADRERRRAEALAFRFVPKIADVHEALEYARQDFQDLLLFLPSAEQSSRESPYRHPDKIYELFRALAEIMAKVRSSGQIGTNLFEEMKKYGFEYKDKISTTAETKFGGDYHFRYGDRSVLFQNHVTRGSGSPDTCISVHWLRDDERKKFVIGWCGKHLRNTMS